MAATAGLTQKTDGKYYDFTTHRPSLNAIM
jgi:hypothetical protein